MVEEQEHYVKCDVQAQVGVACRLFHPVDLQDSGREGYMQATESCVYVCVRSIYIYIYISIYTHIPLPLSLYIYMERHMHIHTSIGYAKLGVA